jgi:hypothetical protein
MRNLSNVFKSALVASAFAASMLAVSTPAEAGKYSNFTDALKHYTECATWLVSDPAKHAQFCDPGHDVFVSGSTGSTSVPEERCAQSTGLVIETPCVSNCCI